MHWWGQGSPHQGRSRVRQEEQRHLQFCRPEAHGRALGVGAFLNPRPGRNRAEYLHISHRGSWKNPRRRERNMRPQAPRRHQPSPTAAGPGSGAPRWTHGSVPRAPGTTHPPLTRGASSPTAGQQRQGLGRARPPASEPMVGRRRDPRAPAPGCARTPGGGSDGAGRACVPAQPGRRRREGAGAERKPRSRSQCRQGHRRVRGRRCAGLSPGRHAEPALLGAPQAPR